jgi:hypothetical protein
LSFPLIVPQSATGRGLGPNQAGISGKLLVLYPNHSLFDFKGMMMIFYPSQIRVQSQLNETASALSVYGDSIAKFPLKANLSSISLNNIKLCEYAFVLACIIFR